MRADIFTEYVTHMYTKKANAKNKAERTLYKLFLNALYGGFGQPHSHPTYVVHEGEPPISIFQQVN